MYLNSVPFGQYFLLFQGLWSNWCLWHQGKRDLEGAFDRWIKCSCDMKNNPGIDLLLDEMTSLLMPQLLLNRPPQCEEQV